MTTHFATSHRLRSRPDGPLQPEGQLPTNECDMIDAPKTAFRTPFHARQQHRKQHAGYPGWRPGGVWRRNTGTLVRQTPKLSLLKGDSSRSLHPPDT